MVMTYVVTCVLLLLAPLAWRKGWHWTGLLVVVLGVLYALTAQPWVQELLRGQASAWLAPQQGRWDARLGELGRAVDELRGEVQGQGAAVEAQAGRLEAQQAAFSAQQEAQQALEEAVEGAQRVVAEHQVQLAELSTTAADLSDGVKTESFAVGDAARLIVVPAEGGSALAYLQLAQVPRPGTLTVRWFSTTFQKDDRALYKNVLMVRTKQDAARLSRHPLSVSYVPDSTKADERTTMSLQDGAVVADGKPMADLIAF